MEEEGRDRGKRNVEVNRKKDRPREQKNERDTRSSREERKGKTENSKERMVDRNKY
jgi:hypothetical protein